MPGRRLPITLSDDGQHSFPDEGCGSVAAACNSIRLYDTTTGEERLWINRKALHIHFTDNDKTTTGAVRGAIYVQNSSAGSKPARFAISS